MNQNINGNLFETAKKKISESSRKLYLYSIIATILGIFLVIVILITVFVFLTSLGITFDDIDLDNIYASSDLILNSGILTTGLVIIVILGIVLFALIIIMIMSYVQYYKLGTGFKKLYESDPGEGNRKYISYGIYGYVIAIIIGVFIPGIAGSVVSILGNISLAIGVYLIYLLFKEYNEQGRFKGKPSIVLFVGIAINVVSSISSMFNDFGSTGSIIGLILMLIGFKALSKDIILVEPQTGKGIASKDTQVVATAEERLCPHCGDKITTEGKFCQSCGKSI